MFRIYHLHATCSARLLFDVIMLVMYGEEYEL
jgi:hypothetical protein